jgi:phosphoribosyl 1,2-cyclic phosphodiesterase
MRFKSLSSGSSGNATVIEVGQGAGARRLMVDCGLGLRALDARLAAAGLFASDLHGLFITHEHADHIGCALGLSQRHKIPVWMSHGTWAALGEPELQGRLNLARDGEAIDFGGQMSLHPFTVPHDAREPLQLTCRSQGRKLGILTDLGHITPHVLAQLAHSHALLLEANHDAKMLAQSSYPPFLRRRIAGPWGHLENSDSARALQTLKHDGLTRVVAAHLSAQNNHPDLVRRSLSEALQWPPEAIDIANQSAGSAWFDV